MKWRRVGRGRGEEGREGRKEGRREGGERGGKGEREGGREGRKEGRREGGEREGGERERENSHLANGDRYCGLVCHPLQKMYL